MIIEIEDGLTLEEGWENTIITEDFENEDSNILNEMNNRLTNEFNDKETQPIEKLLEENSEETEQCKLMNSEVFTENFENNKSLTEDQHELTSLSKKEQCEKDSVNTNLNNNEDKENEVQRLVDTKEKVVEINRSTNILIERTENETKLKERYATHTVEYNETYLKPKDVAKQLPGIIKTPENKLKENISLETTERKTIEESTEYNITNYNNKQLPENIKTPENKLIENNKPETTEKKTVDESSEYNNTNHNKQLPENNIKTPENKHKEIIPPETIERIEPNKYENVLPGITVPSPFKTALFWPGPSNVKKTKRKLSDKIPSVGTSDEWRQYYLKKENQKKEIERAKEERKRKREEKVKQIERPNKRTRTESKANQNKDDVPVTKEDLPNKKKLTKTDININDYVIVNYLDDYYPGRIVEIENDKYLISTMTRSGLNKWKWPSLKDEIFYDFKEILQKIEAPWEINKRGFFEIKDFERYQNFLLN